LETHCPFKSTRLGVHAPVAMITLSARCRAPSLVSTPIHFPVLSSTMGRLKDPAELRSGLNRSAIRVPSSTGHGTGYCGSRSKDHLHPAEPVDLFSYTIDSVHSRCPTSSREVIPFPSLDLLWLEMRRSADDGRCIGEPFDRVCRGPRMVFVFLTKLVDRLRVGCQDELHELQGGLPLVRERWYGPE